jgi:hypothetical protein
MNPDAALSAVYLVKPEDGKINETLVGRCSLTMPNGP